MVGQMAELEKGVEKSAVIVPSVRSADSDASALDALSTAKLGKFSFD